MLTQRSTEKELLDLGPDYYTPQEFEHCQKMLFRVKKLFGFFNETKKFLKKYPTNTTVLDVGCGAGLFILYLSKAFPHMTFQGTDISLSALKLAEKSLKTWQKKNLAANVLFTLQTSPQIELPENSVDIILTTLVCHHIEDKSLVNFLQKLCCTAKKAVVIHDLHRHGMAEFLYRLVSPILFYNRLITHDGLISIRRGFTRLEWQALLTKAQIKNYTLKWRFPFRWSLILWK